MNDTPDDVTPDPDPEQDDVQGHLVEWDVPRLMLQPSSGVQEAPAPVRESAPTPVAAARRRPRLPFGRPAPSPSTG